MTRLALAALALLACPALPAAAALSDGAAAPGFTAEATLGGKQFVFTLAEALKRGPVVLYFYPAAFTRGCTIEAHDFAEAVDRYKALGATVIGVSGDDIATLDRFSVSACQSAFPVAADPQRKIMRAYDSVLIPFLAYSERTSYVITPDGKVLYSYTALNPDKHVANTINALAVWRLAHPAIRG